MIVVGVDGSESARATLRIALDEAALRGMPLRVVHAWLPAIQIPLTEPGMISAVDIDALREAAEHVLTTAVAAVPAPAGVEIERVLVEDTPADAILQQAESAKLIVVGQHGRGAVAALVLGSVSHHVLQHALCPVLVVPAQHD